MGSVGAMAACCILREPIALHVVAAKEIQPNPRLARFTHHLPLEDYTDIDFLSHENWVQAVRDTVHLVSDSLQAGSKVLVSCLEGLNRSGLICALTLCHLGVDSSLALECVRRARSPKALSNSYFVRVIGVLGPLFQLKPSEYLH
jgi:protein-tyrosine phosphatase